MEGANFNCEALEYDYGDCVEAAEDDAGGTDGDIDGGATDGGTTDGGTTDGGTTDGGTTDGGTTDGGTTDGGTTDPEPEPEPVVGGTCALDRVYDCSMNCITESSIADWIGDGYCDDGTYYVDLYCETYDNDGGDCDIVDDPTGGEEPEDGEPGAPCGVPGEGRILDCVGNCADGELLWRWAEDEFCDDGTFTYVLTCEYFAYDGGECDEEAEPPS